MNASQLDFIQFDQLDSSITLYQKLLDANYVHTTMVAPTIPSINKVVSVQNTESKFIAKIMVTYSTYLLGGTQLGQSLLVLHQ